VSEIVLMTLFGSGSDWSVTWIEKVYVPAAPALALVMRPLELSVSPNDASVVTDVTSVNV